MNAFKTASFVGIVLFIFGIIIAIYGFSFLADSQSLDENGVIVKGKVIDIAKKAIYRSPIVQFKTLEGQSVTFKSKLEVNKDLFKYTIGQEVKVIYDKNNPQNAEINAFWERNMAQLYLGIFGVGLMIFGLFFRRRMLKKAKKYS